ncbi:MAG: c-type cytochrome [Alphaproteobacteria bacterium]|nr:c-type cytochrome [Alphaproteobacteria bacterium]HPF48021.1 c-type cytochrome [Emcibacteraceae bacterium]HRW28443.1 c-type cytochrome [Emcibacteraceae bacterium]
MSIARLLFLIAVSCVPLSFASAQNPFENPKNLTVLPKDISPERLRDIMRGFTFATGERCSYCHVRVEDEKGAHMDFESDDKETKAVTREMMKMVGSINQNIRSLDRGADHHFTRVMCTTCHRGQANPMLIEQVMDEQIADGGTAAAKAKYNELKDKYYGKGTFDFSGFTMAEYANSLLEENKFDAALDMAMFSREIAPGDSYTHTMVGNVYMKEKKYADAIKAYEAALAISPDEGSLKRQIDVAKKAMAGQ